MGSTVAQSYMRKEPVTMKNTRFVGLDGHAATIAVAVAEPEGEVRSLGTIPNEPDAVRRLMKRLGPADQLRACYEAGPCGYTIYWQLVQLGVACQVIAPTLVPVKPGDRVKTDRRDAERLARSFRSGDLTAVWVPDAAHEALRDLVRAREAAKRDQLRARHRLQSLRGVARISAATIIAELGQLSRFHRARQLMGYAGVVSSEHSSGERIRGRHHQDGQRTSPAHPRRGCL